MSAAELSLVKPTEQQQDLTAIERVVVIGDLSKLTPEERWSYYKGVCQSLKLNPFTRPFQYITLSGRLVLYATKDCGDQLRQNHSVSIDITSRERIDDLYVVTARATMPSGRRDEEIGAVTIGNLRGDALANALMKATTKAKRRVTLSICGLGMLDETEIETIPNARIEDADALHGRNQPTEEENARAREMVGGSPVLRAQAHIRYRQLAQIAADRKHKKAPEIKGRDLDAMDDATLAGAVKWLEEQFPNVPEPDYAAEAAGEVAF